MVNESPREAAVPVESQEFTAAYDAMLARWPEGTAELDVPTPYGTTRVHALGPADGTPLVLLPGGGATGTVWYAEAAALGARHRVLAVDLPGEPGRSLPGGRPVRTPADLTAWLDALLDGLGADRVHLCGHSYGAWIALAYAVHAPGRVDRLALLDPTGCFAGFRPGYLLRALPLVLRPTPARARAHLARETAGAAAAADAQWQELYALGAGLGGRPVVGRRPDTAGLRLPVLVLLAERSGVHDVHRVAENARRALPQAEIATLAGASHHTVPTGCAAELDRRLLAFLDAPADQAAFGTSL
ncbi:alpha/beta fold hydrolase [Kitasatospora sp. NPDC059571]|uniref:alpha/beta fold hydrolase n=1 Tax=Kitasatospora sp. NPDC059571 TaxID=3346871 RepID=UPI0036943876